ncbi:MAG: TetR family transcriptional regulator [Nitriliruptoraceae bacterium]|jgi:AcrR family transcriptional regulator
MAEREAPGRQRILEAAMAAIEAEGEAGLRILEIAAEAEVAQGLISHHFGSRDGLVVAAQRERFAGQIEKDRERLMRLIGAKPTRTQFIEGIAKLTRDVVGRARRDARLDRAAMLGAAHGRPEYREALGPIVAGLIDGLTHAVSHAQAAGYVQKDLDPRAVATFIQAYAFGIVLSDLDERRVPESALAEVIERALAGILTEG